jgi:hypothetical protein
MAGLVSVDYEKLSSFELFKGLNRSFVEKAAFGAVTKSLKHREFSLGSVILLKVFVSFWMVL